MATESPSSSESVSGLNAEQLEQFKDLINEEAGLVLDKPKYRRRLKRKIVERMDELGIQDPEEYFEKVCFSTASNRELRNLINASVVNETLFYRNNRQMKILEREIFPRLIASRGPGEGRIRILSAGCSNGAEPYSIVMAYLESLRRNDQLQASESPGLEVLGVDISTEALEEARQCVFSRRTVENAPKRIVSRYFEERDDGYRVSRKVQDRVTLRYLNLIDSDLPSGQDVIFHRNVLIYFEPSIRRKVVERLHRALEDDGLLVLGHSEDFSPYREYFKASPWKGKQVYVRSNGRGIGTSLWSRDLPSLLDAGEGSDDADLTVNFRGGRARSSARLSLSGSLDEDLSRSVLRKRIENVLSGDFGELTIDFSGVEELDRRHLRELSQLLRTQTDHSLSVTLEASPAPVKQWARRTFDEVVVEAGSDGSSLDQSGAGAAKTDDSSSSSRIDQVLEEASESEDDVEIDVERTSDRYEITLQGELDTDENPNLGRLLREEMTNCVDLVERDSDPDLAVRFEDVNYVDRNVVDLIKRFRNMTRDKDFDVEVLAADASIRSTLERWNCSARDPARVD